ncbi:hypothetical protein FF098_011080 [Parvularcula flava]|uniref:Divergent polysaccharide deacetylase family protein n=1 Tax=Aquisalinus luteolus TaxID=1566827 RepID=A0A8J3ERF2_9PROT|nr:divergent polysaccharide deacetylase family protein [Aquisalinus luteolus]NHK28449.1 hypothetical protein [Aquisalinus luteolus]GGH98510.1 hypothetical protein GCM10011355_22270 [Aquisalinus luteolus]
MSYSGRQKSTGLKSGGFGTLTLAWTGLALFLVAGAAVIQFADWSGKDDAVIIDLSGEPESFARPTGDGPVTRANDEMRPAITANLADDEAQSMPTVRAARPGEFAGAQTADAPTETPASEPQTEDEALAGNSNASVIRVEDLPRAGEAPREPAAKPLRVAGTPPPAADAALYRQTGNGPMPQIASDGRRPARYYTRTFAATEGAPRIGLIVSGLGLSRQLTDRAIATLPAEATLAFAPYARNLDAISRTANEDGHELMIELPMEASGISADQLGPAGLMTNYETDDNLRRLDWMLTRFTGYFGVTNYLGTAFSTDVSAMSPVIDQLRGAGLAYISDTRLADNISLSGIPNAQAGFVISGSGETLTAELTRLENTARDNGRMLAKIYVTEDNLDTVAAWASGLKDKGIALAPASAMLD